MSPIKHKTIRMIKDKIFLFIVGALTLLAILPLFHIIISIVEKGLPIIMERGLTFITGTLSEGGIGPAIVGTLMLTFLATLIGLPLAFLAGAYAYEFPNSFIGRATKMLLQIMLEFPTILVGTFVMGMLVVPMGTFSALAGALALALILTPYVAVYTEEAMAEVPKIYKEGGYALGCTRAQVIFKVITKMAKKGILTGILIGMAKVAGETAPLLFTAGGLYEVYPTNPLEPVGAIPLLIYTLVQSPSIEDHQMAWGAALVMLIIFLAIFVPIRYALKDDIKL
ncbi:phosphate transport system permease protein A (pstA) [Methanocaldococcus jannaschii DSM 2661]|uniref:Probable phosphate transport system permease protein PstA n=1 Tax=Methanocaldococcus jannaschii (strain ATCC 43067 / DSM 2661 / JAL-1 / JCM 10045 / NBRC 100440) TaxID=243232 RepID=PSTA_METJA|nr:phosphate ABC transporter permease PstA [Methanocaldococcus jannaschii]Q58419.1 RecName: Full=Probable phosphate transport system permease protein PstA [Methanocaldococcus jannaschii DSM 2661]AAB99017.1 phosphate transport system permease protein A (pstA) [Methanocaldococcus jannaschii DSM 2661]